MWHDTKRSGRGQPWNHTNAGAGRTYAPQAERTVRRPVAESSHCQSTGRGTSHTAGRRTHRRTGSDQWKRSAEAVSSAAWNGKYHRHDHSWPGSGATCTENRQDRGWGVVGRITWTGEIFEVVNFRVSHTPKVQTGRKSERCRRSVRMLNNCSVKQILLMI